MRPAPKIVISGVSSSGKSTLAAIISKALDEYGICGVVVDQIGGQDDPKCYDFKERTKTLKNKAIIIETVQLNRAAIIND